MDYDTMEKESPASAGSRVVTGVDWSKQTRVCNGNRRLSFCFLIPKGRSTVEMKPREAVLSLSLPTWATAKANLVPQFCT